MISKTLAILSIIAVLVLAGCSSNSTPSPSYASGNTPQDNSPQGDVQQNSSWSQPDTQTQTTNPDQSLSSQNKTTIGQDSSNNTTNSYEDIETSKDDFNLIDQALNYT
jgi:outer membrane biogenesis lipoprotein LolB